LNPPCPPFDKPAENSVPKDGLHFRIAGHWTNTVPRLPSSLNGVSQSMNSEISLAIFQKHLISVIA
jgi:hypothetical protein